MRTIMAPAMVRVIENNIKNGNEAMRFFEIANIYLPKALPLTEPPVEKKMICLGTCGVKEDFFAMKGALEAFAGANDLEFTYKKGNVPYLHPGRTAEVYCKGEKIGHFGQLRYEIVDNMNIAAGKKADTKIFIAEIDYMALAGMFKEAIKYVPETGFASNSRDLSVLVNKKVECGSLVDAIKECDELIKNKEVDLYVNKVIEMYNNVLVNIRPTREQALSFLKLLYPIMPFMADDINKEIFKSKYLIGDDGWI
jgi:phenylalanyl-tRNA synthetase beta chain